MKKLFLIVVMILSQNCSVGDNNAITDMAVQLSSDRPVPSASALRGPAASEYCDERGNCKKLPPGANITEPKPGDKTVPPGVIYTIKAGPFRPDR